MSYGVYDNTKAMMEFTEILKNEPSKAYDFISCNIYRFTKEGLADILKEVLYSVKYHTDTSFYDDLYEYILRDVQIELDENYDEAYQEYDRWINDTIEIKKGSVVRVNIGDKTYDGCIIDFLSKLDTKEIGMFGQLIKVYIYNLKEIQEFTYGYELTSDIDNNFDKYIQ